jgi:endonuclease/exonuclease/phosphatase family metal-dependent hydrolase
MGIHRASFLASFLLLSACGAASGEGDDALPPDEPAPSQPGATLPAPSTPAAPPPAKGTPAPAATAAATLQILTYNVAGLPQGLSSSQPAQNTPLISPKLNPFELVLVQEDFSYHSELVSAATHAHKSTPMPNASPTNLGDGLNVLSRIAFSDFSRTKWTKCNGTFDQKNDCLTSKGFARFVVDVGGGRTVDVYDAHFDAGRSDGDAAARDAQVTQLAQAIAARSAGKAVIVAGDTNMKASDEPTFQKLLTTAGLTCACRSISCAEPERIDRVMFRSSASLKLSAKSWHVESFVDGAGNPLSDHEPVSVEMVVGE